MDKDDIYLYIYTRGFGLVWFGLVLWHINNCRLFNAKSIFLHMISSSSNNLVQFKYSVSMSKTLLFQTIQFSISTQFNSI